MSCPSLSQPSRMDIQTNMRMPSVTGVVELWVPRLLLPRIRSERLWMLRSRSSNRLRPEVANENRHVSVLASNFVQTCYDNECTQRLAVEDPSI